MKYVFFIIGFMYVAQVLGQSNDKLVREEFTLEMSVDSVHFYQSKIPASPYMLPENVVQVYPGETLFLEAELKKGNIHKLKVVRENLNPSKTIVVSFSQQVKGRNHQQMMLKVENPFEKELVYAAGMFLMQYDKWVGTSVYPVKPGLSNFETWPDIIVSLALTDWSLR